MLCRPWCLSNAELIIARATAFCQHLHDNEKDKKEKYNTASPHRFVDEIFLITNSKKKASLLKIYQIRQLQAEVFL